MTIQDDQQLCDTAFYSIYGRRKLSSKEHAYLDDLRQLNSDEVEAMKDTGSSYTS